MTTICSLMCMSRNAVTTNGPKDFGARMEMVGREPVWSVIDLDTNLKQEILELSAEGMKATQISKEVGCTRQYASKVIKDAK